MPLLPAPTHQPTVHLLPRFIIHQSLRLLPQLVQLFLLLFGVGLGGLQFLTLDGHRKGGGVDRFLRLGQDGAERGVHDVDGAGVTRLGIIGRRGGGRSLC